MDRLATILPLACCACCALGPVALLRGQEPAEARAAQLAKESRERAEAIEVKAEAAGRAAKATLRPEPLMKYTDAPRQIEMATLWVWEDDGRPVALAKVEAYGLKDGTRWLHCFASASGGLVEAKWPDGRQFKATKAGVQWVALKEPAPQATAAGRLRQMKELFGRFSAATNNTALKTTDELRPLARPLYEYAAPGRGVVQGVLCGFAANGTNPDVVVALEAVGEADGKGVATSWRYGVIGMTTSGISVRLDKDEVFARPPVSTLDDRDTWTHFWEAAPKK